MNMEQQCFTLKDLAISRCNIMYLGIKDAYTIDEVLDHLLYKVLDGALENSHEVLVEEAKRYLKQKRKEEFAELYTCLQNGEFEIEIYV